MQNLGSDLQQPVPADETPSLKTTHPLAGGVAALRRIAFVLLLAGAAEIAVWFGNVRVFGGSGGIFSSIAIGVIAGTLLLAVTMAVLAYVVDLQIYINADKTMQADLAEHRSLTTT
jgi:hypothetical protein